MGLQVTRGGNWPERAVRYSLQIPIRFWVSGNKKWTAGETVNLSKSGALFSSEELEGIIGSEYNSGNNFPGVWNSAIDFQHTPNASGAAGAQ